MLTEIEHKITSHKPVVINYANESSVSYSQYSMYSKCPYSWYLTYVKKAAPTVDSINSVFGDSIHETIQHYITTLYKESGAKADELDLIEYFNQRYRENYKKAYDKSKQHFSSAIEMKEFFDDGIQIIEYFKKHRKEHFPTSKIKLLGIELPLVYKVNKNLYFKGYVDIILYDESEDIVRIYDIKTSTRGWMDSDKKDDLKTSQLLVYKEFFAKQYGIDIDKIDVQFFIVKRKLYETTEYTIPRIQIFEPANGKIKRKKVMNSFETFLNECFNSEGKPYEKEYEKIPSKKNCKYCPFNEKAELCDKNKAASTTSVLE